MATVMMVQGMRCACVDIGSNTTRVLVADVADGTLREVTCEKAFTSLGSALRRTGALPEEALDAVAETVAVQAAVAHSLGAERLRVVATAAIRAAGNAETLVEAVRSRAGVEVEVLDGAEEARLSFAGATRAHAGALPGRVAVVDVGGGSTELAVGTLAGGVQWSASLPVGSSTLADRHLRSDPPTPQELAALRADAERELAGASPPEADVALAVGGNATSMARLVPGAVDDAAIARAIDILRAASSAGIAAAYGLDPERVRLLPAGLHLLGATRVRLGCPLTVGRGGLREGICLELAGFTTPG
jgi:exopolyphosphatase / guanosine-5'-triphosphate,3'-diphosphate pyrophosphatase